MNLVIKKEIDGKININEVSIVVKANAKNPSIDHLIKYISEYEENPLFLIVNEDNYAIKIDYKDIVLFFSDKKNNYCKTMKKVYKTRKRLYEIEENKKNF